MPPPAGKLTVRGIDRALFEGSFVLRALARFTDAAGVPHEVLLGSQAVLSRRNVVRCANCLTHLEVVAHFPLDTVPPAARDAAEYRLAIQHRGRTPTLQPLTVDASGGAAGSPATAALLAAPPQPERHALPTRLRFSLTRSA